MNYYKIKKEQERATKIRENFTLPQELIKIFNNSPQKGIESFFDAVNEYLNQFNLRKNLKIADFGAGTGLIGQYIYKKIKNKGHHSTTYFIDLNKKYLDFIPNNKNFKKINKNLFDINYKEKFDIGLISSVLHHFNKEGALNVFKKIKNSLKKNGILVCGCFISSSKRSQKLLEDAFKLIDNLIGAPNFRYFPTEQEFYDALQTLGFNEITLFKKINEPITTKRWIERNNLNEDQANILNYFLKHATEKDHNYLENSMLKIIISAKKEETKCPKNLK